MIRILFTIVAVVAAILGVVLPMPELFIAAGLALVGTIGFVIARMQRRRSAQKPSAAAYAQPDGSGGDDLASLGILDIRPREKGVPSQDSADANHPGESGGGGVPGDGAVDEVEALEERSPQPPATASSRPPKHQRDQSRDGDMSVRGGDVNGSGSSGQSSITIKEKERTIRAGVDERVPDHYREVIVPYLQSFRAAIHAHTVCLLKQPIDALHHQIEGIVSLNGYARSGGDFATKVPMLQTRDSRATTEVRRVSNDDFPASGLGYYRETIAVKEIAVTPVPGEGAAGQYVLLADSMTEHALDSERSRSLMGHFARLLGAVMDDATGGKIQESYDTVRPRRDIINEEIDRARSAQRPLALALVHLNRAESVADLGEREVKNEERALAVHLRKTARDARVERFGELTFGVFFAAPVGKVEKWATKLQKDLENVTGSLEGGVSIGIAVLQGRHTDADALRRDATDALREAYESGTCTIVE